MMTAVVAWLTDQFPQMPLDQSVDLASAMLDVYYSGPQYYGAATMWELHRAATMEHTL